MKRAFTLIELLVVVAVLAILSAIALPNLLQAQTRAKVSASQGALKTLATAMEWYRVDHQSYPPTRPLFPDDPLAILADHQLHQLTTPVAYVSAGSFGDPFGVAKLYTASGAGPLTGFAPPNPQRAMLYYNYRSTVERATMPLKFPNGWGLVSIGPDIEDSLGAFCDIEAQLFRRLFPYTVGVLPIDTLYDPTNGTTSSGDIVRLDGGPAGG